MMLSDVTSVAARFQRSLRVDKDIGSREAIDDYVLLESCQNALEVMARSISEAGQRAFTWTGPFGTGKSSLALALAALVSQTAEHRRIISKQLQHPDKLNHAFGEGVQDWVVIPVVGRRNNPIHEIREAIQTAKTKRLKTRKRATQRNGQDIIRRLSDEAKKCKDGGVLLIIDEMGKFLEHAGDDHDIHFFQELAESANRCDGRLIVLGILHQSFAQYAHHSNLTASDEWKKIQGRFIDIPIISSVDEVIHLIGQSIECTKKPESISKLCESVAKSITTLRQGSTRDLAKRLEACAPLHPVTAALLGPISRSRFAQNERSIFGFLVSVEPHGFQEFLRQTETESGELFGPDLLWDYLHTSLGPAIMASQDSHRFAQGIESIERCKARGNSLHIKLAKSIALIDLFHVGSGVHAAPEILQSCCIDIDQKAVEEALADLSRWSVVIYRHHLNAYAIFAGSDFDIQKAIDERMALSNVLDFKKLERLANLTPVSAKEHYFRTGTLRWFDVGLTNLANCENAVATFTPESGAEGKLLLVLPPSGVIEGECRKACKTAAASSGALPVAVGLSENVRRISELGLELTALDEVRSDTPELEGDPIARREIRERMAAVAALFEEETRRAISDAIWYVKSNKSDCEVVEHRLPLSRLVSKLADNTFYESPIIRNELINKIKPSSNCQGGVRRLLYRMIDSSHIKNLGIEGFPPERSLYSTVLEATGLHGKHSEGYGFADFHRTRIVAGMNLSEIWKQAKDKLEKPKKQPLVSLDTLYKLWASPPFGIRQGILPVLAMAVILIKCRNVAVYVDDMFMPELDDLFADKLLQDPSQIKLRYVTKGKQRDEYLTGLADSLKKLTKRPCAAEELAIARELVRFVFSLPNWTRRTTSVSEVARSVRNILLHASDPHQTLYNDIPQIFRVKEGTKTVDRLEDTLRELKVAYDKMLSDFEETILTALGFQRSRHSFEHLANRAKSVTAKRTGEFRLDSFANRLKDYSGQQEHKEGIASLAINKPPRDWSDHDPDKAKAAVEELAMKFRHAELFSGINDAEKVKAKQIADNLISTIDETPARPEVILAALSEISMSLLSTSASTTHTIATDKEAAA